ADELAVVKDAEGVALAALRLLAAQADRAEQLLGRGDGAEALEVARERGAEAGGVGGFGEPQEQARRAGDRGCLERRFRHGVPSTQTRENSRKGAARPCA